MYKDRHFWRWNKKGETKENALKREMKEEFNIDIIDFEFTK